MGVSFFQIIKHAEHRRLILATIPVLTLGIMGSALFPLPTAFEGTGLVAALVIMAVVAMVTVYACELLMDQCTVTGQHDYEMLSYAVGGIWWQRFTEISIVVLLVGTLVGGFVQTGEIFSSGALAYAPDGVPDWVQARSGSFLMVLAVCFIVFPASLVEFMTQLEYISMVGFVFVLIMTATVIFQSCANGLPGWYSGEFAPIGFQDIDSVGATVSVIGFAFYLQPIAMPMLREMPPGEAGYKILSFCMRVTIMGFAFVIYFCLGFFGASRWGAATEGDLLQNVWGPGPYQGTLNTLLGIYLAFTMPPICYPTAHVVKNWFPGGRVRNSTFGRRFIIVSIIIFPSLAIALGVPGKSADIVTATGAIGVFSSCYFVPIMNHFFLFFGWARCQQAGHPTVYSGEADEMSYRGNGKLGDAEAPDDVEDSAKRGDPAYKQDKIHAAMEDANTKPGVKAVPAALETSANGAPGVGGTSKGGMIVGDVHSYRSRRGMLSLREALVDVLLPIIVLLIGALCSILAFRSLAQTAAAGG